MYVSLCSGTFSPRPSTAVAQHIVHPYVITDCRRAVANRESQGGVRMHHHIGIQQFLHV